MPKKRPSFKSYKEKVSQRRGFKEKYDALQAEFDLANQLLIARKKSKLSQTKLASILGTQQPAIARFERGGFAKASLGRLQEYADALGYEVHIELIPKNRENESNRSYGE